MDQQRIYYPVKQLCQALGVVSSRYYAWRVAQVNGAVDPPEPTWETKMVAVFDHHKRRYGTRRLQVELREEDHRVGRQALRAGLRHHGRKALQPKSFVPHNRFHPRTALRSQSAARPATADPGEPDVGERYYVPAAGQRDVGLPVRLSGRMHQARSGRGWQVQGDMIEVLFTSALQWAMLA